jgi:anaerobic dimethyl sulfoxide reductase subunit B (iron-sulfur subunit)
VSEEYGFSYAKGSCVQCHACEIACKSWRGVYPDVKNISISISCMHCVDPDCIEVCPAGAIFKRIEDGVVLVDQDLCTGCQACLESCPFGAPVFGSDGRNQKCDMCVNEIVFQSENPPCVVTCPTNALTFGKMNIKEKSAMEESMKQLIKAHQNRIY